MDIKEVAKWLRGEQAVYEEAREYNRKHENRQSMLRANAQAEEMSAMAEACGRFTWRPIETAPMDNVDKLLWVDGFAIVGRRSYTGDGTWYCELETTGDYVEPTHWMPLPDAPQP